MSKQQWKRHTHRKVVEKKERESHSVVMVTWEAGSERVRTSSPAHAGWFLIMHQYVENNNQPQVSLELTWVHSHMSLTTLPNEKCNHVLLRLSPKIFLHLLWQGQKTVMSVICLTVSLLANHCPDCYCMKFDMNITVGIRKQEINKQSGQFLSTLFGKYEQESAHLTHW